MAGHRIYKTSVASVYPHYVAKAEKKGRTQDEVDEVLRWLTGYSPAQLEAHLAEGTDFEAFFAQAPALNPSRRRITGVVCGIRVEDIEDPLMQEIRYVGCSWEPVFVTVPSSVRRLTTRYSEVGSTPSSLPSSLTVMPGR